MPPQANGDTQPAGAPLLWGMKWRWMPKGQPGVRAADCEGGRSTG